MEGLLGVAKRFLDYAFKDINFSYDELTETERKLCTREEFEKLASWVRAN